MRCLWIVMIFGLVGGCSRNESGDSQRMDATLQNDLALPDSSVNDEGIIMPDAQSELDAGSQHDADFVVRDAASNLTDVMPPEADVSLAPMDAATDPPSRTNRGQCVQDSDCPATGALGASCNRELPGGGCQGCGTDEDCPSGAECSPFGGVCASICSNDEDCPAARRCLSSGLCAAQRCVDGACPDPRFSCSELDLCTRRTCATDDDCHATMFCFEGLCVPQAWR